MVWYPISPKPWRLKWVSLSCHPPFPLQNNPKNSPKMFRLKPRLLPILSLPSSHLSPFPSPRFLSFPSLPQTLPTIFSSSSSTPHKPVYSLSNSSTLNNVNLDPRFLSCCMPHKRLKVAVLLSGGVDSSVALRLLHSAGHSCTAFYLKIWFQVNLFLQLSSLGLFGINIFKF